MSDFAVPVVNLNGTPREVLVEQLLSVMRALDAASAAIGAAMPNGRDFQTLPDHGEVTARARAAFRERLAAIHRMQDEFEALAMQIADQADNR